MNLRERKSLKGLVCGLSLLLALFTLAGCGEKTAEKGANIQSQPPAAKQAEERVYQIGEAGSTDALEITITKVEKAAEWINSPAEGREYVIVSFRITNLSKEEQSVGAGDFQYVASDTGSRDAFARTTGVEANPDTFGAADIAPGESFEGSLVYAMPVEMSHIELHYIKSYSTALKFEFDK
jgi:predicted small lipoprotein YifL